MDNADRDAGWSVAIAGILLAPAVLFQAWALKVLWLWFVVPLGVHPITVPWALGICSLRVIIYQGSNEKHGKSPIALLPEGVFAIAIALLIGWIAHAFM